MIVRYAETCAVLARHGVEYLVVGGVAAQLLGVPLTTLDLDVVYRSTPSNRQRLLAALLAMDAVHWELAQRRLPPTLEHLATPGPKLLETRYGRLDVLPSAGAGQHYDLLLPRTTILDLGELEVRVLDLPAQIELKQQAGRPKDLRALPILIATLEERGG